MFFKQKSAYEVLISDWRSDVCSSDLSEGAAAPPRSWSAATTSEKSSSACGGPGSSAGGCASSDRSSCSCGAPFRGWKACADATPPVSSASAISEPVIHLISFMTLVPQQNSAGDRKSTRLNSSH